MATDPAMAGEALRAELARAFDAVAPRMVDHAREDAVLDPASRVGDFSDGEMQQFVNAFQGIFREALAGPGRETRDLVLDTALPPILDLGLTTPDMVRSNVISAVMLTHRLLAEIDPAHRDAAARWLAGFHSAYAHELTRRLIALEAERS